MDVCPTKPPFVWLTDLGFIPMLHGGPAIKMRTWLLLLLAQFLTSSYTLHLLAAGIWWALRRPGYRTTELLCSCLLQDIYIRMRQFGQRVRQWSSTCPDTFVTKCYAIRLCQSLFVGNWSMSDCYFVAGGGGGGGDEDDGKSTLAGAHHNIVYIGWVCALSVRCDSLLVEWTTCIVLHMSQAWVHLSVSPPCTGSSGLWIHHPQTDLVPDWKIGIMQWNLTNVYFSVYSTVCYS